MDSIFLEGFADELVKLSAAKTYPISRFMTSSYNPLAAFGASRFVGSRGLMGRIAKGRVMEQDRNSIAKILEGTGLSGAKAMERAEKVIADSKAGKFKHMKKFPISRFFSSRSAQGALSGVTSGAQWAGTGGMIGGPAGAAVGGILGGGTAAANTAIGTHIHRIIGPRGLAGRIAQGKRLTKNEEKLLSVINQKPSLKKRLSNAVEAMKGR